MREKSENGNSKSNQKGGELKKEKIIKKEKENIEMIDKIHE
jgi:hypothetical protein